MQGAADSVQAAPPRVRFAAMTTDAGVDLVGFQACSQRAVTIQVKANRRPKPGSGEGSQALN